jgi:hypothetical protein
MAQDRFRVFVVNDRPKPGTSASWSVLVPNGWTLIGVECAEARQQAVSLAQPWSTRRLN